MTTSTTDAATEVAKTAPPVVFFDGVCGLCNHFVNFAMPRDRAGKIRFSPLQGEFAKELLPAADTENLSSVVFWNGTSLTRKSAAVVRILWNLGGVWRFLAALMWCIPWPIRDLGYGLTAQLRYRMFGKSDTCRLPTPEERQRFVD